MVKIITLAIISITILALSGCIEDDIIRTHSSDLIDNNTDLYASHDRTTGVNYTVNSSAIQIFLIFHVVGTGAALNVDTNLSINGTVVADKDYRTTAGLGVHEHFSTIAEIPKGVPYKVTNSTGIETIEWREYKTIIR